MKGRCGEHGMESDLGDVCYEGEQRKKDSRLVSQEGCSVRIRCTMASSVQVRADKCGCGVLQGPERGLDGVHRQRGGPSGDTESPSATGEGRVCMFRGKGVFIACLSLCVRQNPNSWLSRRSVRNPVLNPPFGSPLLGLHKCCMQSHSNSDLLKTVTHSPSALQKQPSLSWRPIQTLWPPRPAHLSAPWWPS